MANDYLLEMRGIVKQFDGVRALNGINLQVNGGECIGLCGENGAGKSTLMKVLSGVYPHGTYEGDILWQGQPLRATSIRETEAAGIVIIHQELMLVTKLYGGGHQQLIEIAKALNKNARLLILDEPSSSLTASEIAVLFDIIRSLKAKGVTCIYISHKLDEIAAICDTIVTTRDGQHIATTPMRDMNIDRIIAQMVGREMNQLYPQQEHSLGDVVFEARHVTCWDADNPQRKRVDDVSFTLRKGEILGIAGLVGAGRTELVSAIFGAYDGPYEAEVLLEGQRLDTATPLKAIRAGLAMVPEDRKHHGIVPDLSVGQNMTMAVLHEFSKATRIDAEAELRTVREEIARLKLKTSTPFLKITGLSGGNQQKAVLSKMLLTRPKILIPDEPTRGVDVGAKFEIYQLMFDLAKQGMSIIMVSSELQEVLGISDRVLVIGEGRLRGDFVNDNLSQETVLAAALTH